jgi:quinol monooxygenase YgiN
MSDITRYKLDTAFAELEAFDSYAKPGHFIQVSLWHNGEGFDAHLSTYGDQTIRLTWGEFKALKKLVKELNDD